MLLFSMMKGTSDKLKVAALDEFKDCLQLLPTLTGESVSLWLSVVERTIEHLVPVINEAEVSSLYVIVQVRPSSSLSNYHSNQAY